MMRCKHFFPLLLLALWGCETPADRCAGVAGTCLNLIVESTTTTQVDELGFTVSGTVGTSAITPLTRTSRSAAAIALPTIVPLQLDSAALPGQPGTEAMLAVAVEGHLRKALQGRGLAQTKAPFRIGDHQTLHVRLGQGGEVDGGGDLPAGDLDLAFPDGAIDMSIPDGGSPDQARPDLVAFDQTTDTNDASLDQTIAVDQASRDQAVTIDQATSPDLKPPPPSISGVTPNRGPTAGGTTITIDGTGFVPGLTVEVDGNPATNVSLFNGRISAVVPAATNPLLFGAVAVTVTNPDLQSASLPSAFTYYNLGFAQVDTNIGTTSYYPPMALGDFDGDGSADLLFRKGSSELCLFRSDGACKFQSPSMNDCYNLSGQTTAVWVGDLDNDGKLDVAAAVTNPSRGIATRLGNGDGTFRGLNFWDLSASPQDIAAGRLNGDGFVDLVTANPGDNTVSVLLGTGAGLFGSPQQYAGGTSPTRIATGRLVSQSQGDLVVVASGQVLVLPGDGTGGFSSPVGLGASTTYVQIADLDQDGWDDLITDGNFYLNNKSGGLQAPRSFTGNAMLPPADLNGDGILDLPGVVGSWLYVSLGLSSGALLDPVSFPLTWNLDAANSDCNNDGKPDVIGYYAFGGYVSWVSAFVNTRL